MLSNIVLYSDKETSYERFLAGLASHLPLTLSGKFCDYFNFTDKKKEDVNISKTPGLSLLLTLEEMGLINPIDVSALETPLRQHQLVQAVAKMKEYQSLLEESRQMKKSVSLLEGNM